MQSQNENGKQQPAAEPGHARNQELSEAWRVLLGAQPATATNDAAQVDPAAQVQPQTSDPWNALLHVQGMETVDLQKVRLHELHPAASDEDIEHALNIMQEAAGQQASQEKKPGEA
jgi:hypothetical protein